MQSSKVDEDIRRQRKQVYLKIVNAFEEKYSWLGRHAARELLMSAASWNVIRNNDVHMRYRNHVMLAWEAGWLKSSLLKKMADILGDDMVSVMGKVTDAGMRGSVSSGQFTPPKPLSSPIVVSTEFGQTDFQDELLNLFLSLTEEGYTNITLNKLGQLSESEKRSVEKRYDGQIKFGENNEYDLNTDFVFWGATYDPRKLDDGALRSRLNIVTPPRPLTGEVTEQIDKSRFRLDKDTIRQCRKFLKSDAPSETNFRPPSHLYKNYAIKPRESRDIQAYMAARNWWGLDVNPEIMESYLKELKKSRRRSMMNPEEYVLDLIFDNALTYDELQERTGYDRKHLYKILQRIDATTIPVDRSEQNGWVVYSRSGDVDYDEDDDTSSFLSQFKT